MTVIAVLLLLVGCTVIQTGADSIQRNFKLQQLEYGLSLKDSLILKRKRYICINDLKTKDYGKVFKSS